MLCVSARLLACLPAGCCNFDMYTLFTGMEIENEWMNNEANTKETKKKHEEEFHEINNHGQPSEAVAISKLLTGNCSKVGNNIWTISDEKKDAFDITNNKTCLVFTFSHIFLNSFGPNEQATRFFV